VIVLAFVYCASCVRCLVSEIISNFRFLKNHSVPPFPTFYIIVTQKIKKVKKQCEFIKNIKEFTVVLIYNQTVRL
jgi:hypothetical protein